MNNNCRCLSLFIAVALCLATLPGCSYILFFGYLIGGPPSIEPKFDADTKESMTDKDVTVAVICFAPNDVRYNFESVDHEVSKYVTMRLAQHHVDVINPDRVRAWLDENKDWDKPEEIGAAFNTTYVVYIDLNDFSLYEDGSATLYRGKAEAIVSVYKMDEDGTAERIFLEEIRSRFPLHQPKSASEESYNTFKARYLSRLSEEIGRLFYEYYVADDIVEGG
jgi:hypothetical protein